MNKEALEELKSIYSDVSEWLKFAEAKNATLLAGWTAVFAIVTGIDDFREYWPKVFYLLLIVIVLGLMWSIATFIPNVNRCKWISAICYNHYKKENNDNCIFFQSLFIKSYNKSSDEYTRIFSELSDLTIDSKLERDYVNQIINVAQVATIKTFMFYLSAIYTMIIFVIGVVLLLIA